MKRKESFAACDELPEIEPIGWTVAEWNRRAARGAPYIALLEKEGSLSFQKPPWLERGNSKD